MIYSYSRKLQIASLADSSKLSFCVQAKIINDYSENPLISKENNGMKTLKRTILPPKY